MKVFAVRHLMQSTRFANPVGDDEGKATHGAAVPANTQKFAT